QLAALGLEPGAVSDLVITHPHFDHINGLTRRKASRYVPVFPNARHYLGAADWLPDEFEPLRRNTIGAIHADGLLQLVDDVFDLGDGLEIIPAPGETPGHQLLHLRAQGLEAYLTGDLYHHPLEFAEPDRDVTWAEPQAMRASKAALMAS